jgi:hypothetical protein
MEPQHMHQCLVSSSVVLPFDNVGKCMAITLELSESKWRPEADLERIWQENREALVALPLAAALGGELRYSVICCCLPGVSQRVTALHASTAAHQATMSPHANLIAVSMLVLQQHWHSSPCSCKKQCAMLSLLKGGNLLASHYSAGCVCCLLLVHYRHHWDGGVCC